MSRLRDNPAAEVPKRVLILGVLLTGVIIVLSLLLDFNLLMVILFFWLATGANLIAFRIIVVVSRTMVNLEDNRKKSMLPNLLFRYTLYLVVFILAWTFAGIAEIIATFVGVQMASIAIKTDNFFTGGD